MAWADMTEVERLAHSIKNNTTYKDSYSPDDLIWKQAEYLLSIDSTPGTSNDRPDNWLEDFDAGTPDASSSERTYTFYAGNETVESGADGISYLWNQEGYSEATEDDLRAYFDQATNLQETFGDFNTYLQYMNERQDLIDSGEYDPGSWGSVVDTGGLSYQDPYGNYIDPDDYNNLSPNDFASKYGLDKSEVQVIQVDTTKGRQDAYNDWLNSEAVQALNAKYGISNVLRTDDGREYQWNGSGWVKTKERETLDFGGIAKIATAAGFGALVGPALGSALGSALGLGSTAISALGGALSSALQQVALGQDFDFEAVLKSAGLSAVASLAAGELQKMLSDPSSQLNQWLNDLTGDGVKFVGPDGTVYTLDEMVAAGFDPDVYGAAIQAGNLPGWTIQTIDTSIEIPEWLNTAITTVAETVAGTEEGQAVSEAESTTVTEGEGGDGGGEEVEQCDDSLRLQDPSGGCGGCIDGYHPDEFGNCVVVEETTGTSCGENEVYNEITGTCQPELFYEPGSPCNTAQGTSGTYDEEGNCIETAVVDEGDGENGGEGPGGTGGGTEDGVGGGQGEPCTTADGQEGTLQVVPSLGFGPSSEQLECVATVTTQPEPEPEPEPETEQEACPEGQQRDEQGNCVAIAVTPEPEPEECPEGQQRDEQGNCVAVAVAPEPEPQPEDCPEGEARNEEGVCVAVTETPEEECPEGQERDEEGVCVAVTSSGGGGGGGGFGGGGSGMFSGAEPVQIGFDIAGDPQLLARSEFPITDYLAGLFKGIV